MEKLTRRSDGIYETQSGLFAVLPLRSSGNNEFQSWFDYKAQMWSETIRIRWDTADKIAVIPQKYAISLFNLKYASTITPELADQWNEKVENFMADALNPQTAIVAKSVTQVGAQVQTDTEQASGDGDTPSGEEEKTLLPEGEPPLIPPEIIAEAAANSINPQDPPIVLGEPAKTSVSEETSLSETETKEVADTETPAGETEEVASEEKGTTTGKKKRTLS